MENVIIAPIESQADWNSVVCVARNLGYALRSERDTPYERLYRSSRNAIRLGEDGTYGNGKARWYEAGKYSDYTTYEVDEFLEEFGSPSDCGRVAPASFSGAPATQRSSLLTKITHLARVALSKELREALRLGLITSDLRPTAAGQEALTSVLFSERLTDLVAFARANRKEDKDSEDESESE